MKKTIFSVLLSAFIIYLLGTMLITPKIDASPYPGYLGPAIMLMCCSEVQSCCASACSYIQGDTNLEQIHQMAAYHQCLENCVSVTRSTCSLHGQNST